MANTYEDVWASIQALIASQRETDKKFQEIAISFKETEHLLKQQSQDTNLKFQETEQLLKQQSQDTDRKLQEATASAKESSKEVDRQLRELVKQIGGLGEKFGSFTEGLALPSMTRILQQKFGMEVISPSVCVTKGGQHVEVDVLAYANSAINKAYLVEVKSHPREESITQLKKLLERFREFFPEHRDKQVFGILAAVDLSSDLRERILREGLYVARIHDQVFEMDTPEDFQPKSEFPQPQNN